MIQNYFECFIGFLFRIPTQLISVINTLFLPGHIKMRRLFSILYITCLCSGIGATEIVRLSALDTTLIRQGWGSPGIDKSVDGNPLTIGGRKFSKGIGSHAPAEIRLDLQGDAERLIAWVGVDEEGGALSGKGSVEFIVLADGRQVWKSPVLRGGDAAVKVDIALQGIRYLVIKITDAGDDFSYDHADLADARIEFSGRQPRITPLYSEPVSFRDDFSSDTLTDLRRYAQHYGSWRIVNGVLVATTMPGRRSALHILPGWGRNASIEFRTRSTSGTNVTLGVLIDSRYGAGPATPVYLNLDNGSVLHKTDGSWKVVEKVFVPGKWARIQIIRSGDEYVFSVNGKETGNGILEPKTGGLSIPAQSEYGGFTLNCEPNPDNTAEQRIIEIDDLSVSGDPAPVWYNAMEESFMINGIKHWFTVIHENGYEPWARGQLKVSIPYLQWCANFYDVPPITTRLGMTQCRGTYYDSWSGFNDNGVVLWQAKNEYAEFCNNHELVHNWTHLFGDRWSVEGFAGITTIAHEEEQGQYYPLHKMEKTAREIKDRGWTDLASSLYLSDNKIFDGMDFDNAAACEDNVHVAYWKSAVFCGIIYRLYGRAGIQVIAKAATAAGHPLNTAEIKSVLSKYTGRDQSALFNGWAFPGKGKYPVNMIFTDGDTDGLCDLEEIVLGTDRKNKDTDNDGIDDYTEIIKGFDPLND